MGLTNIVRDKIIYDVPDQPNLANWEPNISVLGNSVFLIECNTFAVPVEGFFQRYALAFQPVAGGANGLGDAFITDENVPYLSQCNDSRQNGNPGRVAGDKRPGAVNFIAGGEASLRTRLEFNLVNPATRWGDNLDINATARFACVQTYSLNPTTLAQKTNGLAFDAINGRLDSVMIAGGALGNPEVGRFGGELAGLDNGSFVVTVDDRSLVRAGVNSTTAVIVAPDGSIIKESFLVHPGDIWSNLAAYKGGFCIRRGVILYFFDNAGTATGTNDTSIGPVGGVNWDGSRGDGHRVFSHINSPYVFVATGVTDASHIGLNVLVAAFDSRTATYITHTNVNELSAVNGGSDDMDFAVGFERSNGAADALNRLVVAYEAVVPGVFQQVVCRVLQFNPGTGTFSYLTHSFLPFVNNNKDAASQDRLTQRPSVAMTTRQICVAAKGTINSMNDTNAVADTQPLSTFYTVINVPSPQDDPTTPARHLTITRAGANAQLCWEKSDGLFTIQATASLGPTPPANWQALVPQPAITAVGDKYKATVTIGPGNQFFRLFR